MKKRFLAMVMTLAMLLSLLPASALAVGTNPFTDVESNDWFYDEVLYVNDEGLMTGTSTTTFSPDDNTTRGMIVTILHRLTGTPEAADSTFQDVADDQYYADAVDWAAEKGVVTGYDANTFGPMDPITREQLATILCRYASLMGYDVSTGQDTNILSFVDAASVSAYAVEAMQWAVGAGLINGTDGNRLDPQGYATRAQVAAILYRFCTQVMGDEVTPAAFTVTLTLNYGDNEVYKTLTTEDGKTVTAPKNPTRSGYTFAGWYTAADGGEKFDFSDVITGNVTLYAKWTKASTGGGHSHNWGNWTYVGNGQHERICSKNNNHKQTEACRYDETSLYCIVCGYKDDAIHISSVDQLKAVADAINQGDSYEGKTIALENNIDLSKETWEPIGNGTRDGSNYTGNAFKGTFDGNGYTISNVTTSLFGVVDGGTVQNVKLVANIDSSADSVGAAVALLCGGTVDNVSVSGTVKGLEGVGGVVGRMLVAGTVTGCTNNATVTQTGTQDSAGGIVGKAYYTEPGKEMTIRNCSNSGTVTSDYAAGGIVGFSAANVTDCTNSAAISANLEAGGIVGEQTNYGEVSGNTNSGDISANKSGGIIGWVRYQENASAYANNEVIAVTGNTNSGTITGSGDVSTQSSAGGIVGLAYNQATVTGNTNSAASISASTFAAGIVGAIQQEKNNLDIDSAKFVVSNNATTTTFENISANCKDLYVYNNDPNNSDFATIEGNGEKLVAKIGEDSYTSLQDAINAASGETTVTLIDDTEVDGDTTITVPSGKNIALDLNGKTLAGETDQTGSNRNMFDVNGGKLTVENGTITMEHKGANMEWNSSTAVFNVTAGGVLNLDGVTVENLGGSDMAFCVHLNNWGEVTLNATNSTLESTYCAVRVFNSGPNDNNVSIINSTLHGDNRAFWVHNYSAKDFGANYDADAVEARLKFDLFNGTNTITSGADGTGTRPIHYGFSDAIYYDAAGNLLSSN